MNLRSVLSTFVFPTLIAAACASEAGSPDGGNAERGGLGKADLFGSCEGPGNSDHCGGKSSGNCWCDDACVDFGDCCSDAADVCGVDLPEPDPQFCGGFAGISCPDGMHCVDDPSDDCDPQNGGADCGGICVEGDGCSPVLCELFCPFGFETDENGCEICECKDQPDSSPCTDVGGQCLVGFITECPEGLEPSALTCGDTNIETVCCAPAEEPSGDTCEGSCDAQAPGGCWCDDLCTVFGDCCDDVDDFCADREIASGQCVRNSLDACETDADCTNGGCGGELCFNPDVSSGISTCDCTQPQDVTGCGCVEGQCAWWN